MAASGVEPDGVVLVIGGSSGISLVPIDSGVLSLVFMGSVAGVDNSGGMNGGAGGAAGVAQSGSSSSLMFSDPGLAV